MLPVLMMLPEPWRIIAGAAYFMPRTTPRKWVAMTVSKCVMSSSAMPASRPGLPALLKRQSRRPNFASASSTIALTSASLVTSVRTKLAAEPSFFVRPSPSACRRPAMTTLAPSSTNNSTVRAPIPLDPPVTIATLPSSAPICVCPPVDWQSAECPTERKAPPVSAGPFPYINEAGSRCGGREPALSNNAAERALFRSAPQLQNQTAIRKTAVHVTGLPAPTMNCITELSFRLIMSVTSRPMKRGTTLGRKPCPPPRQRTPAPQIPVKVSEGVRLAGNDDLGAPRRREIAQATLDRRLGRQARLRAGDRAGEAAGGAGAVERGRQIGGGGHGGRKGADEGVAGRRGIYGRDRQRADGPDIDAGKGDHPLAAQRDDDGRADGLGDGAAGGACARRRQRQAAGQQFGLALVHHKPVERGEGCARHLGGRRAVQHDARPPTLRPLDESPILGQRNFHLEHHQRLRAEQRVGDLALDGRAIGPRRDDDEVAARAIDGDQRTPRRECVAFDRRQIDAGGFQFGQRQVGKAVTADAPDHAHLAAGARRSQRLIGALAAGYQRVVRAEHGLARTREPLHGNDQIDVDGAEDDDHDSCSSKGWGSVVGGRRK